VIAVTTVSRADWQLIWSVPCFEQVDRQEFTGVLVNYPAECLVVRALKNGNNAMQWDLPVRITAPESGSRSPRRSCGRPRWAQGKREAGDHGF